MGCMQVISDKYLETTFTDEEKNMREWEKKMGFFRNNFASVYSILITDENKIKDNSIFQKTF